MPKAAKKPEDMSFREKMAESREVKGAFESLEFYRKYASPKVQEHMAQFQTLSRSERIELLAFIMTGITKSFVDLEKRVTGIEHLTRLRQVGDDGMQQ